MTDSYVPTTNANGTTQNIASQQSERDGETIETQEFALTAEQLEALVPPSVATLATSAKQDTQTTALGSLLTELQGKADVDEVQPVSLPTAQIETLTPPAQITGFATAAKQDLLLAELEKKADLTETQPVSGPLTDAQLRATPVPVSGSFEATGALTDEELRATPVPVSGTVTANTGLTQPLTDTELRATAVPVSGTVSINADQITAITPPANPDPSTETKQDDLITAIGALNTAVGLLAKLTDTQPVDAGYSKISTLNSASGTFSGANDGSVAVFTGDWEETADYGEIASTISMPDAVDSLQILIEYSANGVDAWGGDNDFSNGSSYTVCQGAIRLPYFRVYVYATVGVGDHEYSIKTILKKKSIQTYPYMYTSEGYNTRLLGDSDGNLKTLAIPDDDTRAARGLSSDPRSTATDTTPASLIALMKQNNYLLLQVIDALTP